jgi:hypothetical protein
MHSSGRREVLKTIGGAAVGLAAPAVIRSARAAPPFFKLYLMIPNNQPARMIWGTLAAQQMSKLGIDVISSYVDFPTIASRRTILSVTITVRSRRCRTRYSAAT